MKAMNQISVAHLCRLFAAGLSLIAVCACSALRPAATPHPAFYSLEGTRGRSAGRSSDDGPGRSTDIDNQSSARGRRL